MERLGCDLCEEDRNYVLRAYVNRYTRSHVPAWATTAGQSYPVQFADDADWLKHTMFFVRADGRLDLRRKHCESTPTWPDGRAAK